MRHFIMINSALIKREREVEFNCFKLEHEDRYKYN
jgi:hypothetical protein